MSHGLEALVQFSLVNRVLESKGVDRSGPFVVLLGMTACANSGIGKTGACSVPLYERRIIRIKVAVNGEVMPVRGYGLNGEEGTDK
jgi:hypothetical protein